jgi:hypothetical protein
MAKEANDFAITPLASVLTLALVAGEAMEHPFFHFH